MRGLRSKLQRRLRLLLWCLVLSLAAAPPLVGVAIAPPVAALVSHFQGLRGSTPSTRVAARSAPETKARQHLPVHGDEPSAALVTEHTRLASSRVVAFDGPRLYLVHLAFLC